MENIGICITSSRERRDALLSLISSHVFGLVAPLGKEPKKPELNCCRSLLGFPSLENVAFFKSF